MADPIVRLLAGLIPAIFSAFPILLSTHDMATIHLINPALEHARALYSKSEIGANCIQLIASYFRISLDRLELMVMLSFIAAGLLSQAIILLVEGVTLSGLSYLIYASAPMTFGTYYVMLRREVFHWWGTRGWKFALVVALMSSSAFAAINPELLSILDIMLNSKPVRMFGSYPIPNYYLQILIISAGTAYLVTKAWTVFSDHKSLRDLVLEALSEHRAGYPLDQLTTQLQNKTRSNLQPQEVKQQLQRLIYQELVTVEPNENGLEIFKKR